MKLMRSLGLRKQLQFQYITEESHAEDTFHDIISAIPTQSFSVMAYSNVIQAAFALIMISNVWDPLGLSKHYRAT